MGLVGHSAGNFETNTTHHTPFIKERAGKGSAPYGPPVDVWAIGVLLVMMLKGVAFVPASDSLSEYFEFWRNIIGRWSGLQPASRCVEVRSRDEAHRIQTHSCLGT